MKCKANITYALLYGFTYLLSLLPLRALYVISDIAFLLVFHCFKYRRKVVSNNLVKAFPDKDDQERSQIERSFYHWLCDYAFETIKLLSINDKRLLKHIEFRGVDQLEQCYDRGQSCAAILGHYCNWEWLSATGLAFHRYPQAMMGLIYHPLYNDAFDRLFVAIRSAHGGDCIPKKDVLRRMVTCKQQQRPYLFGYISDQSPRWKDIHLWLTFMNQDTAVFTGGERIMRKANDAVFYVDMQRPRRGQYVCTFKLITDDVNSLPEHEVTRRFFQLLEESIHRQPELYLWTHRRWKRTKEEFDRLYNLVNGHTIPKDPNVTGS